MLHRTFTLGDSSGKQLLYFRHSVLSRADVDHKLATGFRSKRLQSSRRSDGDGLHRSLHVHRRCFTCPRHGESVLLQIMSESGTQPHARGICTHQCCVFIMRRLHDHSNVVRQEAVDMTVTLYAKRPSI